jgi:hypothetical protein
MARAPRKATLDVLDTASSPASKINLVIGIVVGCLVIASALVNYGKQSAVVDMVTQKLDSKAIELSTKVDTTAKEAQAKVDLLSSKVDMSTQVLQTKQDALTKDFAANQAEQMTFRTNVQNWLTKQSDSLQGLSNQVNQERVDRLTEAAKKK